MDRGQRPRGDGIVGRRWDVGQAALTIAYSHGDVIRYGLVSCVNTALDLVLFAMLWPTLGAAPANVISYSAGILTGFFLNRIWTFRGAQGTATGQLARFVIINVGGLALSTLFVGAASFLMAPILAKAFSYPLTFSWNYGFSRMWVFRSTAGGRERRAYRS